MKEKNVEDKINQMMKSIDDFSKNNKLESDKKIDIDNVKAHTIEVVKRLSKNMDITEETAYYGMLLLLQSGAYLKGVNNRVIKLNNKEISKRELVYALEQTKADKITLRNIAYALRNEMAITARYYKMPGNLFAKYRMQNTDLNQTTEEMMEISIYCTDVQYDNPNAPVKVRDFLSRRKIGGKS